MCTLVFEPQGFARTRNPTTVPCEERDAVCSLERAFQAAAIEDPDNAGTPYPPEAIPKKKKQLLLPGPQESDVSSGTTSGSTDNPQV